MGGGWKAIFNYPYLKHKVLYILVKIGMKENFFHLKIMQKGQLGSENLSGPSRNGPLAPVAQ